MQKKSNSNSHGTFPEELKLANIIPIHKKGDTVESL